MAKARVGPGLVATCLLLGGVAAAPAWAQTNTERVAAILNYRPRQEGVNISTPTPEEMKTCTVELVKGTRPTASGWLLKDPDGKPLRKFFDRNGDRRIDLWSYYKDGVEVYREMAVSVTSNPDELPDAPNHFRWLNAGGTKWGIDLNRDGKIDIWKAISAEEAAQEVFQAVVTRNYARLQALFLTEAEMRALKLPAAEIARLAEQQKQAAVKFQKTLEKLGDLGAKTNFVRVESGAPQCIPAEGTDADLIKYASRSILYENAGKHDWLQTGEMFQVASAAWRLVDAPAAGDVPPPVDPKEAPTNSELQKLLEQLSDLDKAQPEPQQAPGDNPKLAAFYLKRIGVVEQILKVADAKERDTWIKQLADNFSQAVQAGDKGSFPRLTALKDDITKTMPGTNLAGYLAYRVLWTDFAPKIAGDTSEAPARVQEQWMAELTKYVQAYPKADDTADALWQLAVGCEFGGKEEEAKRWYQQLPMNFPENPLTAKAAGAIKRLELVGKTMELAGTTTTASAFDLKGLSGKVVVVYYWASYCKVCTGDFARMKQTLATYGPKGMELVTVNLDDRPEEASKYLQATPLPGTHLVQPATGPAGGLTGPLAIQYGINGLPSMFLVGKDGKVISTKMQINDLEEAVRKAL